MIDEGHVLTTQERMKKAINMRRLLPKLGRAKEIQKKRMADMAHLEMRAEREARNRIRNRLAGLGGKNYQDLSNMEKSRVDKIMSTKSKLVKKIAKRLLPRVRRAEQERLANRLKNAIAGQSQDQVIREVFDEHDALIIQELLTAADHIREITDLPESALYTLALLISENDVFVDPADAVKVFAEAIEDDQFVFVATGDSLTILEGKKEEKKTEKHVHVVYSNGEWGNRQWQYRIYSIPDQKKSHTKDDVEKHLKTQGHHVNLAKAGWHVEHAAIAHRSDMDKTQGKLNKLIIKHAESDANLRKRLTAAEKPPEKKKK